MDSKNFLHIPKVKIPPMKNTKRKKDNSPDPRKTEDISTKKSKRVWKFRTDIPNPVPPFKLNTIENLIDLAWYYRGDAFDWYKLWKMIPSLEKLNKIVGMRNLKKSIINMIVYYLQGFNVASTNSTDADDSMHTVLTGPPGCGKTTVATIIGELYHAMGILSTNKFTSVKRYDLIGKFIGHTEDATRKILEDCLGGVLFIDEAYSMGSGSHTDSFSKASVDILNSFLSEHKRDFVCIIAGYKTELDKDFFTINPGLRRRFAWNFDLGSYNSRDLLDIFKLKVSSAGWFLEENAINSEFFDQRKEYFPFLGGDIETFWGKCKMTHAFRMFGFREGVKILSSRDILKAYDDFKTTRDQDMSWRMIYT